MSTLPLGSHKHIHVLQLYVVAAAACWFATALKSLGNVFVREARDNGSRDHGVSISIRLLIWRFIN